MIPRFAERLLAFALMPAKRALLCFAGASALILAAALAAQYGFGLAPCHLCLLQRYPYAGVTALGLFAALLLKPAHQRMALLLCALLFLGGAGVAFYHTGVEYGWFPGPSSCTADAGGALSVEDIRKQIMNSPLVACDQPLAKPLGISLAAWNAMLYGLLMLLGFKSYQMNKPRNPADA